MRNKNGFTLIETLMVIVLLGIMGTGLVMYFVGLSSSSQSLVVEATSLAQAKMEEVMALRKSSFNAVVSEAAAALPAPYDGFTRSVEVFCVNEADLDTQSGTMPACADSDIRAKRVDVTISWTGGSAAFTTIITDH